MIDIAEKLFVKIADQIISQKVSVRTVWNHYLFPADIDGEEYELLAPEGLVDGMRDLGLNDISEMDL